jgi:hypothetical protein
MLINAIEGFIENGQIRLREKVSLPEHSKVYVIVADSQVDRIGGVDDGSVHIRTPRFAQPEQSKDFSKQIVEFTPDA